MVKSKKIVVTSDASGAYYAAVDNMLVMVVDIIDMSTTLESALDAGAYAVFGCSPDKSRAPVRLNPEKIGIKASQIALDTGSPIVIATEPRWGTDEERIANCSRLITTIESHKGVIIEAILPNIGAEAPKMITMQNKVVIAVTETGGVAFDAAYNVSGQVITGTIARTYSQKGVQPARSAARRAVSFLTPRQNGIAIVAASRNSLEDVLAAQYIANLLLQEEI